MADTFELVDLPAGPQPIPRWAKGMHINWMDGWGNPPRVQVKCGRDPEDWPDKRYKFLGGKHGLYLALQDGYIVYSTRAKRRLVSLGYCGGPVRIRRGE